MKIIFILALLTIVISLFMGIAATETSTKVKGPAGVAAYIMGLAMLVPFLLAVEVMLQIVK